MPTEGLGHTFQPRRVAAEAVKKSSPTARRGRRRRDRCRSRSGTPRWESAARTPRRSRSRSRRDLVHEPAAQRAHPRYGIVDRRGRGRVEDPRYWMWSGDRSASAAIDRIKTHGVIDSLEDLEVLVHVAHNIASAENQLLAVLKYSGLASRAPQPAPSGIRRPGSREVAVHDRTAPARAAPLPRTSSPSSRLKLQKCSS